MELEDKIFELYDKILKFYDKISELHYIYILRLDFRTAFKKKNARISTGGIQTFGRIKNT